MVSFGWMFQALLLLDAVSTATAAATASAAFAVPRRRIKSDTSEGEDSGSDSTSGSGGGGQKEYPDEVVEFKHFTAYSKNMTCSVGDHTTNFNTQIRGVNLGGWMVLEPWITPSLFMQFLGKGVNETGFDMYTFCEVLGPEEGNRQLKIHWDSWVTEDIIKDLADSGAVNSVRLPIGDFMYVPYGPYIGGCVDGALEKVEQLLDWCYSYGITVLLDIHTMKDSQNGFDNSGQSMGFAWTSALSSEFAGLTTFEHWPVRDAAWIGEFDTNTATYSSINYENIKHALKVVQKVVDRYAGHPAVHGLEPVNEPWQYTPIEELKRFYWEGYLIVKKSAPYWKFVMHDSFRLDPNIWGGFMAGCPERALDTHIYQAWHDPDSRLSYYNDACSRKSVIATMEREFGPVIVGEWSLATDNCAMWLNGFNDNLPGFPRLPCKYSPCAESYLGSGFPGIPVDPAKALQGPYGTGMSGPIFGLCPTGRDWVRENAGHPFQGVDWITAPPNLPKRLDDTDEVMTHLAYKKISAFAGIGHGFYFWNFRTDLYEPQWSYMAAMERGWIPRGSLNDDKIRNACQREDLGEFKCIVKRGQLEQAILGAVGYCLDTEGLSNSTQAEAIRGMTGKDLEDAAGEVLNDFFTKHRLEGATCDFGGIAMLIEENRTLDDDYVGTDDYYSYVVYRGPPIWMIIVGAVVVAIVSSLLGFILAMRYSPSFNRRVRSTAIFRPIAKSKSSFLRSSLALPAIDNYDELDHLWHQPQGNLKTGGSAPSF